MCKKNSNTIAGNINASDCSAVHVLVLIAGTTSPINVNDNHAISYLNSEQYWDQQFYQDIQDLTKETINLELFDFHGWSGDNSIENRKIAGQYLINRLCGAEGEKSFYVGWKKKPVYFHLLGHSHGGNVINEMTQQISKLGDTWPESWKIKSLIYLSVPFFTQLHQVKVNAAFFHPKAEVFHAYNDYDLTQRMLADFSLEPLRNGVASANHQPLMDSLGEVKKAFSDIPMNHLEDNNPESSSWEWYDKKTTMTHADGLEVFQETITAMEKVSEFLLILDNFFKSLNHKYTYPIHQSISNSTRGKLSNQRTLVSDQALALLQPPLNQLQQGVLQIIDEYRDIVVNNPDQHFSKIEYLAVMLDNLSLPFQNFIDINPDNLIPRNEASLWGFLHQVLKENIDQFDDTYVDPTPQFGGSMLAGRLEPADVTTEDLYDKNKSLTANYRVFIKRIETIEKRYAANPSISNLMDLLFSLLAQDPIIYDAIMTTSELGDTIGEAEWGLTGETDTRAKQVRELLTRLRTVFEKRSVGGLVDETDTSKIKRGSIPYLLIESHSTSRRRLHKKLKSFIKRVGPKC